MEKERYLGDGVYASFDGYQLWLRAERDGRMHQVAVENAVLHSLNQFAETIWPKTGGA